MSSSTIAMVTLSLTRVARAESAQGPKAQETKDTNQGVADEGTAGRIPAPGPRLEGAHAQPDVAASRTRELDQRTQNLTRDLEAQLEATTTSRARLERRADRIHHPEAPRYDAVLDRQVARVLANSPESTPSPRGSQQASKETPGQLYQEKKEYTHSPEQQRVRVRESRRHESQSEVSVGVKKKEQTEARIARLRTADQAGLFEKALASGSGGGGPR